MSIASKPPPKGYPRISSSLSYEDAAKAIDWLCRAFGFEVPSHKIAKVPAPEPALAK